MADRKISRNALCPCGSGRKFKKCCGAISPGSSQKNASPSNLIASAHRGETVSPGDRPAIINAMQDQGIDPALIFAFEQTGLLITAENQHFFSPEAIRQFHTVLDGFQNRRQRITTEELLTCSVETFVDSSSLFSHNQCEQHIRAILERLDGVDFETYVRAMTEVLIPSSEPTPTAVEPYYVRTRELFPDVSLEDDILGRLAGLTLRLIQLRLTKYTALHGPIHP